MVRGTSEPRGVLRRPARSVPADGEGHSPEASVADDSCLLRLGGGVGRTLRQVLHLADRAVRIRD